MVKRVSLLVCTVSTFLLPLTSFAAALTPQQALDRSLLNAAQERRAENTAFELDIRHDTKVLKKDLSASGNQKARVRLAITTDTFMRSLVESDGIVTIRVPQFEWESGRDQPIRVQNPMTLELRVVNQVLYLRVSDVAPVLLAELPASSPGEPDLRSLIGTWIKIDPAELAEGSRDLGLFSPKMTEASPLSNLEEIKALLAPGSVFQVTGIERRYRASSGDQMMRLRVHVHPKFIDRILAYVDARALKTGGVKMTAKERATSKKQFQTLLAPLKLVAVVNATKTTLDRVEGSYVKTDSVYRYEWKNNRQVKYYNGKSTTDVRFGVSMRAIPDREVAIPEGAVSLKALLDQWKQANQLSEPSASPDVPPAPPETDPWSIPDSSGVPMSSVTPVNGSDHIRGNAQAPVTVIVYSDYECPGCQRHAPEVNRLLQEFPQDVRVVYRMFPLATIHPNAQMAAEASECAGRVGGSFGFWGMHDYLFTNGANLGTVSYTTAAAQQGLNPQAFEACMNAHEGSGKINENLMTGENAGVTGTPATFINGTFYSGAVGYDQLRQGVLQALGR